MHPEGRIEEIPVTPAGTGKLNAVVDGEGQTGNVLRISGLTEKIWVGSDAFRINGVIGVHPLTRKSVRLSKIFIVTESAEPGASMLYIHPPLIPSGLYMNVGKSPKNGAKITRYRFGNVFGNVLPKS